jgi:dienelactone hydrolase
MLGKAAGKAVGESPYVKEPDADLLVFPDGKYPPTVLSEANFTDAWTRSRREALEKLRPTDAASFTNFMNLERTTLRHTLALDGSEWDVMPFGAFGRPGKGDRIDKVLAMPNDEGWLAAVVIIAHPDGRAVVEPGGKLNQLAARLVVEGYAVLAVDAYQSGRNQRDLPSLWENHYATYNRTPFQERVQDVRTTCAYAAKFVQGKKKILLGFGDVGAAALLAGNMVDATIVDTDGVAPDSTEQLMKPGRFFAGARLAGGLEAAAALVAPKALVLHNTAGKFNTGWLRDSYQALGVPDRFTEDPAALTTEGLIRVIKSFVEPKK